MAHLSLAAGHFDSGPVPVPITALFKASPKKKKRPAPAPAPPASPSFAGIDGADVDPATLSELPPAVRADVERQMRLWEGSRRPGGASPSPQKPRKRRGGAPATPASEKRSPTKSPKITAYLPPSSPAAPAPAPGDAAALDQILAMGFGPNRAQRALDAVGGDAQRAIEQLLGGG